MLRTILFAAVLSTMTLPAVAATLAEDAHAFGAIEALRDVRLSPDGRAVSFLAPQKGGHSVLMLADLASGDQRALVSDTGGEFRLRGCMWKGSANFICTLMANIPAPAIFNGPTHGRLTVLRTLVVPTDGTKMHEIGQRSNDRSLGFNLHSGSVIDPLPDDPKHILMQMNVIPERTTGTWTAETREGLSVQRVDVGDQSKTIIEQPRRATSDFMTDGKGTTRVLAEVENTDIGNLGRTLVWRARAAHDRTWRKIGAIDLITDAGLDVDAVDESGDWIIGTKPLNGRRALYRVAADGSGREELLFASDKVDVEGVLRIGKYGRPVAAQYTLDAPQYHYFDAALEKLASGLGRALPERPIVHILDENADGKYKLVYALSANGPGKYYRYDSTTHHLEELLGERPWLDGRALGPVRVVSYPSGDGVNVPAYLTLPPGSTDPRGLPAILLPHGGPGSRDELGFDWLTQFFAARGYAVLQPEFRGSAGYGNAWFVQNGFKSWKLAIGDVNAGARWLVAQGIANPARIGIFGWSYGGYAALQANVADPGLYKAAVAVAPVTDLTLLKEEAARYTSEDIERAYIGDGPHIIEGSPARNARQIVAPVLIFHGDADFTVDIAQSRRMVAALKSVGKPCDLVVFPGLDHQLFDGDARAAMLARAGAFMDANLGGASVPNRVAAASAP